MSVGDIFQKIGPSILMLSCVIVVSANLVIRIRGNVIKTVDFLPVGYITELPSIEINQSELCMARNIEHQMTRSN